MSNEFPFFVREEYPDGSGSGQTARTLDDAIAAASKSIRRFVRGKHYRQVNAMTVIVGERVSDSALGFNVHRRFQIQSDRSLF